MKEFLRHARLPRVTSGVGVFLLLSAVFSASAVAQQAGAEIEPQMTSSGGEIQQGEFGELFSTIGEPLASDSLVSATDGDITWTGFWHIVPSDTASGVHEEWAPFGTGGSGIAAVAPNPFSEEALIHVRLETPGEVRLTAFDMLGREVRTLIDGHREAGTTRLRWSPEGLDAGAYILKLEIDGTGYPATTIRYVR